jgi:hypothetical protein
MEFISIPVVYIHNDYMQQIAEVNFILLMIIVKLKIDTGEFVRCITGLGIRYNIVIYNIENVLVVNYFFKVA